MLLVLGNIVMYAIRFVRPWVCLLWAAAMPLHAYATLGEAPLRLGASAVVDAQVARYLPVQPAQGYSGYGVEFHNATLVREWVDGQGRVFALRWSGPELPDLGLLLGAYLPAFKASVQAARQAGKRGGPVTVQSGGLVLVSTGVAGAFQGYAYLEAGRPAGLDIQALVRQ